MDVKRTGTVIDEIKYNPGSRSQKVLCPKCSPTRSKKTEPCMSVYPQDGVFICHNCGWKGSLEKTKKQMKVERVNMTKLPFAALDFLLSRGITQPTALRNDLFYAKKYFNEPQKELPCIGFPCKIGDEVKHIQYRAKEKYFIAEKGGEPTFFGLNDISNTKEAIIVEGYIDKLSFDEVGLTNCVSVPNGTTISKEEKEIYERTGEFDNNKPLNLRYLDSSFEFFEKKKKIYLATDNDAPGLKLREELSRRLGKDKCYIVAFPQGCKDANDVLVKLGRDALIDCINKAQPYPLEGIQTVFDIEDSIEQIYIEGLPKCDKIGYHEFDKLLSFRQGELTVITGAPNSGKTIWANQMYIRLAELHGWKFALFSAENQPYNILFADLAEQYIGKPFFARSGGINREELERAKVFINEHFYFIQIKDAVLDMDTILTRAKQLVNQKGIHAISIDPYSALESAIPNNMREDQYLKKTLNNIRVFRKQYGVHVFIIAHPKTLDYDSRGKMRCPKLYDISGGSQWYNHIDNGIIVYRNFGDDSVDIIVEKVRYKFVGRRGTSVFSFNILNNRYEEQTSPRDEEGEEDELDSPFQMIK